MATLMPTYARLPVTFTHGEGVYLYDSNGQRYLDAIAGIGVNSLGHAHPEVSRTIATQAGQLIHTSNLYHIEAQELLADKLTEVSGMDACFFGNSGAEANEAAIKLARLYGHQRGIKKPTIIVLEKAFHGRTLATLTATGNRKIQAGFEPLVSGFIRAPLNDLDALEQIAKSNPDVVAILMEPIQGEGGIHAANADFMRGVRTLCDQQSWLMMLDEVQTGNGRTGNYFAYQGVPITPDVVTTAKGLGNGVPIGVCLAHGHAAQVFSSGQHGSTYGGNPLACATALTVVTTIIEQNLCDNAKAMGQIIRDSLLKQLDAHGATDRLVEIRGRGLMLGIQLSEDCPQMVEKALASHVLLNVTAGNTIRLLPPLILNETEARSLGCTVADLISQ